MAVFAIKIVAAATIISFCSWLSHRKPELAGFIVALPLTTLVALLFSYVEFRDSAKSVEFAKGVFVGVPVSLLFFIPFLFAKKMQLSFMLCYLLGLVLLSGGYFVHKWITTNL